MKEIEEQIAKIIQAGFIGGFSNKKLANKILSEVTIKIECPELIHQRRNFPNLYTKEMLKECKECNDTDKIKLTLKEAIERLQ